jgi:uncharacterized protein YhhL (DUF1145 family)
MAAVDPAVVVRQLIAEADARDPDGPRRWAVAAIALFCAIALLELGLGVVAYGSLRDVDFAIELACGGVAGFALIDWWIRPRTEDRGARRVRRFMPLWSLVPFLCALASSAWVHYEQWQNGLHDIREVATELSKAPTIRTPDGQITTDAIEATLAASMLRRFPGDSASPAEKRQFSDLVRVIGHDLVRAHGDPHEVARRAARDTFMDFCLTLGAQALFVLWIPFLLMISIARAARNIAQREAACAHASTQPPATTGTPTGAPHPAVRPLFHSIHLRDHRILGEDRMLFVPRLCFGTLLVLGTTYVFAPFGLKASYIMTLVDDHALPGRTSFALWCNNFSSAPVIVAGFVGFLIYALITATQRFAQDDFDDQALFALLVRGLIVILLSFALSSSPINDEAARMFVFIAGVFPLRALEAIAKRANITIDPDFPSNGPGSFDGIPSLDPAKVFALRAAGIQSSYDLAAMPIEEIVGRVRIDPRLLGRAVDRAILIDAVGAKLTAALDPFALTSATELVAAQPLPATVTDKLGDAPERAAARLAADPRVDKVRRWLASTQF